MYIYIWMYIYILQGDYKPTYNLQAPASYAWRNGGFTVSVPMEWWSIYKGSGSPIISWFINPINYIYTHMNMYIYICTYVYIYILYIYVYIYVYIYMYVYIYNIHSIYRVWEIFICKSVYQPIYLILHKTSSKLNDPTQNLISCCWQHF